MREEYITSFWELVDVCSRIANELQTMIEVKEYPQYNWGGISFMTDKFGGTYVNLHYDYNTGVVTNWFGSEDAQEIYDEDQLRELVKREMNRMLQDRDLSYIYEMVNSEY